MDCAWRKGGQKRIIDAGKSLIRLNQVNQSVSSCCCKCCSDIDIENDEDIRMETWRKHFGWDVVADILAAREEVQDVICAAGRECLQMYRNGSTKHKIKKYKPRVYKH